MFKRVLLKSIIAPTFVPTMLGIEDTLEVLEEERGTEGVLQDSINSLETVRNGMEAVNFAHRFIDGCLSMSVREALKTLKKGDHIKCNRTVYSHHGIYDGNGSVYEYNEGEIRKVPLRIFADGDEIISISSPCYYSREDIILRAEARMGECDYNLITNNCEHFARWCRNGCYIDLTSIRRRLGRR